jgi:hypothetical protein
MSHSCYWYVNTFCDLNPTVTRFGQSPSFSRPCRIIEILWSNYFHQRSTLINWSGHLLALFLQMTYYVWKTKCLNGFSFSFLFFFFFFFFFGF